MMPREPDDVIVLDIIIYIFDFKLSYIKMSCTNLDLICI